MTSLVKDCFWERPCSFIQNYFCKYSKNLIELFKIILTKKRFYWRYHSHQYNCVICKNATSIKKVSLLMRSHSRVQDDFTGEVRRKSTRCFTGEVTFKSTRCLYWWGQTQEYMMFYWWGNTQEYLHRIGSLQVLHQHVWDWEGGSEPERRVRMVGV